MKNIYLSLISGFLFTACSLDRVPYDALSTATFPKTEADVENVSCWFVMMAMQPRLYYIQ